MVVTSAAGPSVSRAEYGSDIVIEMLRLLDIPYVAYNPGSSFRGIHDSLVNFAGEGPEMVLCTHEEIAVAVAHGYARVTGKPMAAALHSMVGLQHGSMAIYNAWCERMPMLILGGTGPVAAHNRRNWIDWVHTALVQGNQVRDYTKWDDQPGSVADFAESLLRGYRIASTEPCGPVYLCYDVDLQEQAIETPLDLPDVARFRPPTPVAADPEALAEAAHLLAGAQWPVILADAVGRHPQALPALERLAELLCAPVVSVGGFNLASNHPLNLSSARDNTLAQADVVLALDVADLYGALGHTGGPEYDAQQFVPHGTKVIHISVWDLLQHSWSSDFERLQAVDLPITGATRLALPALLDLCRSEIERDSGAASRIDGRRRAVEAMQAELVQQRESAGRRGWDATPISLERLHAELWTAVKDYPWTMVHGGLGRAWQVTQPEQIVAAGGAGGAGLGIGPGASIGSALALRGAGRLSVSLLGDGDFLCTTSALWTAANLKLPLLFVVNNNRSYGNDEGHQELMARRRGRPIENKGVGIYIEDPNADFARIASGFDVQGFGPVTDPAALAGVLQQAASIVMKEQRPVLVDVVTQRPRG